MIFNGQLKPYSGKAKVIAFSKSEAISLFDGEKELTCEVLNRETLDGGMVIEVTKDGEKEVPVPPYYRFELLVEVEALPAMGYQVFQVLESDITSTVSASNNQYIENERFKLVFEKGNLALEDKLTGRLLPQLLTFEEQADDGDSYDFSPLEAIRH